MCVLIGLRGWMTAGLIVGVATTGACHRLSSVKGEPKCEVNVACAEPTKMLPSSSTPRTAQANDLQRTVPDYRPSFSACVELSGGVTSSMVGCIEQEFRYQDDRLNRNYQRLREILPADSWRSLREKQRAWLAIRDEPCERDSAGGGTSQMLEDASCGLDRTVRRADELGRLIDGQGLGGTER
jgi:uncharacterized protein YecT (DUF1311 family)